MEISIISVTTVMQFDPGEVCQDARIVLGAVAPTFIRAPEAENLLKGQKITAELAQKAGELAARNCNPITDIRATAEYRKMLVEAVTKKAFFNWEVNINTAGDDMKNVITLKINGTTHELLIDPNATLAQVLRGKQLNLTGTKQACELGDCGACTVIMDGKAVNSCLVLAMQADGFEITSIEGLAVDGKLSPIQESFIDAGAIQCGFCSSGMMMSAKALLDQNPSPSRSSPSRHCRQPLPVHQIL